VRDVHREYPMFISVIRRNREAIRAQIDDSYSANVSKVGSVGAWGLGARDDN